LRCRRTAGGWIEGRGHLHQQQNPMTTIVDLKTLGLGGEVKARDLWKHTDLGALSSPYTLTIPGLAWCC
jgi:hypothetical protein